MIRKIGTGIKGFIFNLVIRKDVMAVDACCNRAVFYNPYNEVVQCHVCGETFIPRGSEQSASEET